MADIEIRPAFTHDGVSVARRMRQADVDEVYAASGLSPLAGLLASMAGAQEAHAGLVDGNTEVLFGVTGNAPWLLGTDAVSSIPMTFLRRSSQIVSVWTERYGRLENRVDARNDISIKWLQWLGFTLDPAEPWGYERRPFHRFWR